jgi:hypothetical protein
MIMNKLGIIVLMAAGFSSAFASVEELLVEARQQKGYEALFAQDLSNAMFTEKMWSFEEGVLWSTPERVTKPLPPKTGKKQPKHPRDIWSTKRYGDFIIDLEFKCAKDTNSGVFLRCDDIEQWLHTSMEVQILQGTHKTARNEIGAIYDCKAADTKPALKPAGEWNHGIIIAKDNWLYIVLNGELVNTMNLDRWTEAGKNPDGSKNKFKAAYKDMPREGHIGLQYHGQPVWFRNVRVKEI